METTQLTIQLPKTEVIFLEDYAKRHKVTIAELLDHYIRQLQLEEKHVSLSDIEAELEEHAGVIPGDVDVKKEYHEYLEEKYK